MSRINTQVFTFYDEVSKEAIAHFKKINITPKQNDFLVSSIKTVNYCIFNVNSGEFDWKIDGENYHISSNDLAMTCPGLEMVKEYKPVEFGDFYKISLKPEFYFEISNHNRISQLLQKPEVYHILSQINLKKVLILKNFVEHKAIFHRIEHEFSQKEIGYMTRISGLIEEIIIEIFRAVKRGDDDNINQSFDFSELKIALNRDISHNWTVKEMADFTKMGVTQFSHKMKMSMGFSPFDFLIYLRLNRAASLLQTTDFPITQIALDTGFYSSQHFSFTFKKILGTTPSKFRHQA